ncbi:sporulation protein SpoIID [Aphanothece hegewaldii CCALA 016]|uniref:Sporulation protein SpoIID n=1 Tax=Aphanothece hegewaldii CCALA 016 TaxID=2107694 RepID=A0A2T1LRP1_9CHRO|nr:SpoIID/LytB domain-containing protein [Aphanothece hegewaldii]PSF31429.1 sporulation protein SpoIID [Aphanothece hegewaldii CCALA 016]
MKDKKFLNPLFQYLGAFAIPLVSVTAFLPLVFAYWANPETVNTQQQSSVPPISPIPTPTPDPLISPDPVISPPQPIASPKTTQKPPEQKKALPQKAQLVKSEPKEKPAPTPAQKPKVTATKPRKIAPLPPSPSYTPPQLEIRVAIARDESQSMIGVSQSATVSDQNGQFLKKLHSNQGFVVTPNGSNLIIGDSTLPAVVFVQPNSGGLVYVGDRWYRGKILIVSQGSSLLVVNYVNLEEYLYSVVGSEMHPNAPIEALKAQAIAARSYALVHLIRPASPWYNLGNTQRWQVYKGLQSEYNTSHHAVNETAGQILSYKGGVVESLYAATDEIVARAHGGRGMSQTGAYEYAKKGYVYPEILDYYYPGVGLARLVLQQ